MSNSTGSVKNQVTAGARAISSTVAPTYNAVSDGTIDVPDSTAGAVAFSIPFGAVGVGASFVWCKNKSGQDMIVKINGSLALFDLPDGGEISISSAALPASTKLTALSLTTTATVTPAGSIEFLVGGDPV